MSVRVKFWLVWSPQGARPPTHRHASEAAARNEAQRLAGLHPGNEFFVLEARCVAKKVEVQITELEDTWTDESEMPF